MNLMQKPAFGKRGSRLSGNANIHLLTVLLASNIIFTTGCDRSSNHGTTSDTDFARRVERMLEDERIINDFYCECGDEWNCDEELEERDPEVAASCFQMALDQIKAEDAKVVIDCYDETTAGWRRCVEELDECEPDELKEDDPRPCDETWNNFFFSCELEDIWPEELDDSVSECIEEGNG